MFLLSKYCIQINITYFNLNQVMINQGYNVILTFTSAEDEFKSIKIYNA